MSFEKQQQKNTKQKKTHTHLNLSYVDYEDVYGPYIFKSDLNTITYKPLLLLKRIGMH